MNRRSSPTRVAVFSLAISALGVFVWSSAVAAQSTSTTAVPTDAPGATDGNGLALLGTLIAALVAGGLLLGAFAGLASVVLIELFGPFSDRTHLALPLLVGILPTLVLVNSFGIELLVILILTELVALPITGLLVRRRYRR
ncbi:hypothetical protein [Halorubellus litoreus]|uniref:Uncharacterized protein n=1 Tax=Halorubellus litoreus TaxID=755308 RepID=A0ABD5V9S4_9EURY